MHREAACRFGLRFPAAEARQEDEVESLMGSVTKGRVSFMRTPSRVLFLVSVAKPVSRPGPKVSVNSASFYSMAREWEGAQLSDQLPAPLRLKGTEIG